jgi:hypothetical protein
MALPVYGEQVRGLTDALCLAEPLSERLGQVGLFPCPPRTKQLGVGKGNYGLTKKFNFSSQMDFMAVGRS